MRRNAISIGLMTMLLGIAGILWTTPSVPNIKPAATAVGATIGSASKPSRVVMVPTARKKQRPTVIAQVIPIRPTSPTPTLPAHPHLSAPSTSTYIAAVDQPTITENHKKLATAVLNALPSACRDNLKTFIVLYQGATRRGLGGKTTIILDGSVPDSEFVALLTHECGHVIHSNMLGTYNAGESSYKDGPNTIYLDSPTVAFWNLSWTTDASKKAGIKDIDFVSGYAKSDAFEEFAETFALYVLQRGEFRDRAKTNATIAAKLAWMEQNIPLPENLLGTGTAVWDGNVPWDATKLPLTLGTGDR